MRDSKYHNNKNDNAGWDYDDDLPDLGSDSVLSLIQLLDNKNRNIVWKSAYALSKYQDKRSTKPLINLISNLNSDSDNTLDTVVKLSALYSLGIKKDPDSVDSIINLMENARNNEDIFLYLASGWALGMIQDIRGIPPLLDGRDISLRYQTKLLGITNVFPELKKEEQLRLFFQIFFVDLFNEETNFERFAKDIFQNNVKEYLKKSDNEDFSIQEVIIEGLFYKYTHKINFNISKKITIIYGPNGTGKTTIQYMLSCLFSGKIENLLAIPFHTFRIKFDDGFIINVFRHYFFLITESLQDEKYNNTIESGDFYSDKSSYIEFINPSNEREILLKLDNNNLVIDTRWQHNHISSIEIIEIKKLIHNDFISNNYLSKINRVENDRINDEGGKSESKNYSKADIDKKEQLRIEIEKVEEKIKNLNYQKEMIIAKKKRIRFEQTSSDEITEEKEKILSELNKKYHEHYEDLSILKSKKEDLKLDLSRLSQSRLNQSDWEKLGNPHDNELIDIIRKKQNEAGNLERKIAFLEIQIREIIVNIDQIEIECQKLKNKSNSQRNDQLKEEYFLNETEINKLKEKLVQYYEILNRIERSSSIITRDFNVFSKKFIEFLKEYKHFVDILFIDSQRLYHKESSEGDNKFYSFFDNIPAGNISKSNKNEHFLQLYLFTATIESFFISKSIRLSTNNAIEIYDKSDNTRIFPEQLSSGEQHLLILFYKLLFLTRHNSMVLIDEPEISLHVVWKRQFLDEIKDIIDIYPLNLLISTHSPSIIHDSMNLAIGLKG